jgi:4-amino-4-deoxy-L-arabinose transferase-like glycosyltransferase
MSSLPQTATPEAPPETSGAPRALRPGGAALPALLAVLRHAGFFVVVAVSAVLNTVRLSQNGYSNIFYSAGIKSMIRSLHNFFFVSFDPGGLVTVDKPPLGLWVQAASAKAFGFTPLSLLVPEAIIGVLTVAVLYVVLARRLGPVAAFAGAFACAVFPSFVAVSRDNAVDPLLILLMLLAAAAGLRAAETGHWRWLLGSAVLVGLAFNTKALAAYLVVPGIAAAYLLCAPGTIPNRVVKLLVAGAAMVAVSFAWIAVVEATPAAKRPYVGSSMNNTELGLTFEYNGFGRVEGQNGGPHDVKVLPGARLPIPHGRARPRALAPHASAAASARFAASAPASDSMFLPNGRYRNPIPFGSRPSPVRLWGKGLGDQDGWTVPLALFGTFALAVLALAQWRSLRPARLAGERVPDAATGPGLAGAGAGAADQEDAPGDELVPAGASERLQTTRAGPEAVPGRTGEVVTAGRRDAFAPGGNLLAMTLVLGGWFLVEAVVLSTSKGIVHPYYAAALAPATGAMAGAGAVAMVRLRRGSQPLWGIVLAALAVGGSLAAQIVLLHREHYLLWLIPVVVGGCVLGLCLLAAVRSLAAPAMALIFTMLMIAPTAYATTTWLAPVEGTFPAAGPKFNAGVGGYGVSGETLAIDRALSAYVTSHRPGRRWALLTVAADQAAPLILMGLDAGALGGYSGIDPAVDGPKLANMVQRGEARYVLLGGEYSTRGGNRATDAVLHVCKIVPLPQWHSPTRFAEGLALFDCAGREQALRSFPAT